MNMSYHDDEEDLCSSFCTSPLVDTSASPLELTSSYYNQAKRPLLLEYQIPDIRGTSKEIKAALQVAVVADVEERRCCSATSYDHLLKLQKTTIDILGICCPAEVPLVKKILQPLPGVKEVLVNVTARTVTVQHDSGLTSAAWLVKLLNDAALEASIHQQGKWKAARKWPNPYTIVSGIMVAVAFFQYVYNPLRWLGLGAVAVGVPPVVRRSLISLKRCILDINVLMLIAVAGAIFLGDYLEAGSVVFLFTLADWLESRSSDKARMALASVVGLVPQTAVLAESGTKVPVGEVGIGSVLSVKAGEQVPIDGVVLFGRSAVDESTLSGESMLVEKEIGSTVWAGTLNMTGYLSIETTALPEESAVCRMVKLVEEAQSTGRSNVERLVEKFAKFYTPVVVLGATGVAVIPYLVLRHARHNYVRHWLYVALVLLVVACPCALVISTPVATTCAIARAAKMGLIIKSGSALETLGKLRVLALDKTGTLTEGHFQVMDVRALGQNMDLSRLLYWIACIESQSSHPLAASLIAFAKLHGIAAPLEKVENFEILAGEGVSGVINGLTIHIGNERLAMRLGWTHDAGAVLEVSLIESWRSQGWSIIWVGLDEKLAGILCAGDPLRVEAQECVHVMKKLGLQLVMLTGDSQAAASLAQKKLGDDELEVHAQLFPQDKVAILRRVKTKFNGYTGMVGDGINDAPALAAADVGIAMGVAGSAVAMETADVALMTNDLRQLAAAVKLGQRVRWKIWHNIILSVATKLLIILLAAFGFASLWAAVLADVGTCLIVIFNSMLLLGGGERAGRRHRQGHDHHGHNCSLHDSSAHDLNFNNEKYNLHSGHLSLHHRPSRMHGNFIDQPDNELDHNHLHHHSIVCGRDSLQSKDAAILSRYLKQKFFNTLNCTSDVQAVSTCKQREFCSCCCTSTRDGADADQLDVIEKGRSACCTAGHHILPAEADHNCLHVPATNTTRKSYGYNVISSASKVLNNFSSSCSGSFCTTPGPGAKILADQVQAVMCTHQHHVVSSEDHTQMVQQEAASASAHHYNARPSRSTTTFADNCISSAHYKHVTNIADKLQRGQLDQATDLCAAYCNCEASKENGNVHPLSSRV